MLPFINAGHRFVPVLIDLFGSHAALMATIACCGCCRTTEQGARFSAAASGVSDQQAAGPRPADHQEPTTRTVQSSTVRYTSNQDQIVGLLIPACPGCWLRAGWLAGLLSLSLAQRSAQGSQPGGIRAGRAITWVKIQKCRNEESSRKVPRNAGEARGSSTGWPSAMGVKIKLKSDCCSFRPMISLI